MIKSSTGKWLVAASLLPAFSSPALAAADTATLLIAQLDSVAAYCSQQFPANREQYKAFVDGMLSGASPQEVAQKRDSDDYERAREFDRSQLNASTNTAATICSGLVP